MKEVFKRYFPSLITVTVACSMTNLITEYSNKSKWAVVSSFLIWIGAAVLIICFLFELIKSRKNKK